jgi:two-component system, chemotaxis family, chemotaxis protein CheY
MFAIVVDDSAAMRRHLSKALEGMGWQVKSAGNGVEALRLLEGVPNCDLMLTDWHMPEMDGMELCRAVRKETKYNKLRIVMVTSDSVMSSVNEAIKAGANDFVMKPFTSEALSDRLSDIMKN